MSNASANSDQSGPEQDERLVVATGRDRWTPGQLLRRMREGDNPAISIVIALFLIWVLFQSLNSLFLSPDNIYNLSRQISYGGVVSLGLVLALLVGEVDLSVGSIGGLSAAILAVLVQNNGWNWLLAIFITVAIGAALGGLQAAIFTRFGVPSFIVTLGGLLLFYGLQLRVLGDTGSIRFPFGEPIAELENLAFGPVVSYTIVGLAVAVYALVQVRTRVRYLQADLPCVSFGGVLARVMFLAAVLAVTVWELQRSNGVPLALLILLALVVTFWLMTTQTRFGQKIYAVGGNAEAARRAGINVNRTKIAVFCLTGACAAFGGILAGSYVGAASQTLGGETLLLYAIAAVVIGGTSLFGGRGSAWSALLGWLVIGSIYNGMFLLNLESDVQFMIIGLVLMAAVVIDSLSRRRAAPALSE